MAKTYRAVQQWNHWLTHTIGNHVLDAERQYLLSLLAECYGKHALLIGVPHQHSLLKFNSIPHQVLLSPLINRNHPFKFIEGELYELPIASASIDLVLVPHTLELIDNAQKLLSEACRIVKPEGNIVIFGFNPNSLWGLKKILTKYNTTPWTGNFITPRLIKKWLMLADFELVKQDTLMFRPPLEHHDKLYERLKIMEWLGSKLWSPFGGIYMLMAKAKVTPLTPIKLHWRQKLTGLQVTLPGPSVRIRNT